MKGYEQAFPASQLFMKELDSSSFRTLKSGLPSRALFGGRFDKAAS